MEIDYTLAGDDSCQVQLYARGHFDSDVFRLECVAFYMKNFEKLSDFEKTPIKRTYWRSVPAPADCIVFDRQMVESKRGRGAYPVTILDKWLPM
jgi:hypothetical protein